MTAPWRISGDYVRACNCEVLCPSVLSLGRARPPQGVCCGWYAYHVREGHVGDVAVADLNVVVMLEVPGRMEEGNWTQAFYFDERATPAQRDALGEVLSGRAGGPLGWASLLVSRVLEPRVVPVHVAALEREWRVVIPKILQAVIEPEPGATGDGLVRITNSRYWMAPEVVVCRSRKSRFRDHGRNWNFTGRSAEVGRLEWSGP